MDRNKLKLMLKPLIKEILKECILEDGVVSTIIRESMGLAAGNTRQVVTEQKVRPAGKNKFAEAYAEKPLGEDDSVEENESAAYLQELRSELGRVDKKRGAPANQRLQVAESIKNKLGMDVFSGTEAIDDDPGADEFGNRVASASYSSLSGEDPNDPGVDLSLITEIANGRTNWRH